MKLEANQYVNRITQLTVHPKSEPIFSEMATTVSIIDEAEGEFVLVEQLARTDMGKIAIATEEWPVLRAAIDRMIKECREVVAA